MITLARDRLGLRRQVGLFAERTVKNVVPLSDAAFLPGADSVPSLSRHPKAPSSLRFVVAVQSLTGRLTVHGRSARLQWLLLKIARLALAGLLFVTAASSCGAAVFQEDFASDPAQRGWRGVGDASLFQWDAAHQNLAVTWDSSHPNSFFLRPLGTVLAGSDDFSFSFDLRLPDIRAGSTPGKSNEFEIAIGLLNYRNRSEENAFRGAGASVSNGVRIRKIVKLDQVAHTGASVSNGVRNLVEFDYFPDAGFGDTFATTVISTNNVFAYAHNFPLALTPGDVFRLTLSYTAADQVLRTSALRNGAPFNALADVCLAGKPDFRVDAFAVTSYSDAIQAGSPTFYGSVLAHGTVDNVQLVLPSPPLAGISLWSSNSVWRAEFLSATNWLYTLERSQEFSAWQPAGAAASGTGALLVLPDTNAPGLKQFYRVRAERP